jgi:hypothetical protein
MAYNLFYLGARDNSHPSVLESEGCSTLILENSLIAGDPPVGLDAASAQKFLLFSAGEARSNFRHNILDMLSYVKSCVSSNITLEEAAQTL